MRAAVAELLGRRHYVHFSPTAACPVPCTMYHVIKANSPCVRSASAKLFLDLHTVSAPSGEERTLSASAQVERAALCPPPPKLCTAGCAVGAQLKRLSLNPQGRA